jgi:hypothetical protein
MGCEYAAMEYDGIGADLWTHMQTLDADEKRLAEGYLFTFAKLPRKPPYDDE